MRFLLGVLVGYSLRGKQKVHRKDFFSLRELCTSGMEFIQGKAASKRTVRHIHSSKR